MLFRSSLSFSLGFGSGRLALTLDHAVSEYRWEGGSAFLFTHEGTAVELAPGATVRFENRPVFKAVIFDLDGVLADTAILHYQAWKRLADELGLAFNLEANEALKGVSRMESLDLLLGSAAGRYSAAEKAVMADRKNGYYQELVAGLTPDNALPGARELVKELRDRNILVGLASASRNAKEVLNRLGWAEDFDAIADAALARPKPDPEIFLSAAQALGVRRFDCVGVEDAQAGIQAIRGADMKAVAIGQGLTGADLKVDAISRLSVEDLLRLF